MFGGTSNPGIAGGTDGIPGNFATILGGGITFIFNANSGGLGIANGINPPGKFLILMSAPNLTPFYHCGI
jgi:hypothetical protein